MKDHLWKALLSKKQRKSHVEIKVPRNPIVDVEWVHHNHDHHETLSVVIKASHKLDTNALHSVIAELLAKQLLEHDCITISETTNSETNDIVYMGTIEATSVIDPPSTIVNQENVHE